MPRLLCIVVCLLAFQISTTRGQDGFRRLAFNGVDLDGWQVTGGEATVENGSLVLHAGEGTIRTDAAYSDFVLELKWRPRKAHDWDSGVYFRAPLPQAPEKWPERYQANLKEGFLGQIKDLATAPGTDLAKVDGWNTMKLTVVAARATLQINDHPAWQVEGIARPSGYIGMQIAVPEGGQFEFRDIYITELGYRSLFNGHNLDGWEGVTSAAESSWRAADNLLICTGQRGTWLRSRDEHDNFNVRLEYKLLPGGNSGVYLRVPADGMPSRRGRAAKVQILDDQSERYNDIEPGQFCGSVYKVAPATRHVGRPAGQWNTLEIDCRDTHYRVTHNGIVVVDASGEQIAELKERRARGYLGLQNHSEEVWFRNLRIGPTQPTVGR